MLGRGVGERYAARFSEVYEDAKVLPCPATVAVLDGQSAALLEHVAQALELSNDIDGSAADELLLMM